MSGSLHQKRSFYNYSFFLFWWDFTVDYVVVVHLKLSILLMIILAVHLIRAHDKGWHGCLRKKTCYSN